MPVLTGQKRRKDGDFPAFMTGDERRKVIIFSHESCHSRNRPGGSTADPLEHPPSPNAERIYLA